MTRSYLGPAPRLRGDNPILMWATVTGEVVGHFFGHSSSVTTITCSFDDRLLFSGDEYGSLRISSIVSRTQLHVLTPVHPAAVSTIVLSPAKATSETLKFFFSAGGSEAHDSTLSTDEPDNRIRKWRVDSMLLPPMQMKRMLVGHTKWVKQVLLNNDSTRVFSASNDGTVIMWDADLLIRLQTFVGHGLGLQVNTGKQGKRGLMRGLTRGLTMVSISVTSPPKSQRTSTSFMQAGTSSFKRHYLVSSTPTQEMSCKSPRTSKSLFQLDPKNTSPLSRERSMPTDSCDGQGGSTDKVGSWGRLRASVRAHQQWNVGGADDVAAVALPAAKDTDSIISRVCGIQLIERLDETGLAQQRLFSVGSDGTMRSWDVSSGQQIYCYKANESP